MEIALFFIDVCLHPFACMFYSSAFFWYITKKLEQTKTILFLTGKRASA